MKNGPYDVKFDTKGFAIGAEHRLTQEAAKCPEEYRVTNRWRHLEV